MKTGHNLSTKLTRTGLALLVLALVSIGLTFYVTWRLDGGAAAVNEAGRLRMQAWRLVASGQHAMGEPSAASATTLTAMVREFDDSVALLRAGDPDRPLFVPWDEVSRAQFKEVETRWAQMKGQWKDGTGVFSPTPQATNQFVKAIDTLVQQIETHMAKLTAYLNLFQFVMVGLTLAGATIMLYTGYQFVLNPLARLRTALKRVEGGDLSTRIDEDGTDEFAEVGGVFNHMTRTLQSQVGTLEARIAEKTQHLQAQRNRLAALYEVSTFLADTNSRDALAQGFAKKIRVISGADASACRWMDGPNQRFVLIGHDCVPAAMQEEQNCLIVGSCACGGVPQSSRAQVIVIPTGAEHERPGCAKAGFSAIVTVPMRLNHQTIGKVDLFYRSNPSLTPDEQGLLDTLASHLAGALEGLRLTALAREAAVSQERGLLAQELHDSIAQSLAFLKIQVQLLKNALQQQRAESIEKILAELDAGIHDSTQDVRELMLHFRVRPNPEDFDGTVKTMLNKFSVQTGIASHLKTTGYGYPLGPDVQLQVLHIIQEALSNVRKHAKAQQVNVAIDKHAQWQLLVEDDGVGFDAMRPIVGSDHIGLTIMRERAARIGATLTLDSQVGTGTRVSLRLSAATPI